ncbi:klebicin B [Rahnella aquatilis]|nr:klebicin B [Rahnella aquatilis]QBJ09394.1 klebicin B [Rahnella aquatilis]
MPGFSYNGDGKVPTGYFNGPPVTYDSDGSVRVNLSHVDEGSTNTGTGNAGGHDTGSASGSSGSVGSNWAGSGPVNTSLINATISESLSNLLVAVTSTASYRILRAAFDALALVQQPVARDQIVQAWQRAHDLMPDKVTESYETGGSNGHTATRTTDNAAKKTMAQAVTQVLSDLQSAISQHQKAGAAASEAAASAAAEAEKQRQAAIAAAGIAGLNQSVSQSQANLNTATAEQSRLQQAANVAAQNAVNLRQAAQSAESAAQQAALRANQLNAQAAKLTKRNGDYGHWEARDVGGKNDRTVSIFVTELTGSTLNAARTNATNTRNSANQQAGQASAAEQASAAAAVAARDAETRRQAAQAALTASQQAASRAAEAERQRKAAEAAAAAAATAARAAEAERQRQAAEAAAAKLAQAMQARQVAADSLRTISIQSVRGIPVSASMTGTPISWAVASEGGIVLGEDVVGAAWGRISAALAELRGIATASLAGPVAVTIVGLLYSSKVGVGSDVIPGRDISTLISGDVLSLPDSAVLNHAADTNVGISMPVRGQMVMRENGTLEAQLVRTGIAGSVPVVRAVKDNKTGYWSYTLPTMAGVPAQTILVSPADAPGVNTPLTMSGPVPLPENIVHTGNPVSAPQGVTVTTTPVADDLDFRDVILIFPAESGLKPLYVMLRSPRNMPGTVSGKGQPVGDNWLGNAGVGDGAPLPSQITDKLRGRTFRNFDAFRQAFWSEVGKDPILNKQFKAGNLGNMQAGKAPVPREVEQVGGRVKYELHHIEQIKNSGSVYDIDNLRVTTPKRHIEIHKEGK